MTDTQWMVRRFVPFVIGVAGLGVAVGAARAAMNMCLVGIQGMVVGGLVGYAAGRIWREDAATFWSFQQRIWMGLAAAVVFSAASIVTASAQHAGPIDPPLYWVQEVVAGFQQEPFVSVKRGGTAAGRLEGAWWVGFMALDALLLAFLFVALSVAGSDGGRPDPAADPAVESRAAKRGTLAVTALILAAAALSVYRPWLPREAPFSLDTARVVQELAGSWEIEEGGGIFENTDAERRFTLRLAGFTMLTGTSAGANRYSLSIDKRGRNYSGMLIRRSPDAAPLPQYFRMRPSPDKSRLIMSFTVFGIGGRRDIVVTAKRLPRPAGTGPLWVR